MLRIKLWTDLNELRTMFPIKSIDKNSTGRKLNTQKQMEKYENKLVWIYVAITKPVRIAQPNDKKNVRKIFGVGNVTATMDLLYITSSHATQKKMEKEMRKKYCAERESHQLWCQMPWLRHTTTTTTFILKNTRAHFQKCKM